MFAARPETVILRRVLTLCDLGELPGLETPLHLAIGYFDGLHIGHQAVVRMAVEAAAREGGLAGVVTFDPHPSELMRPDHAPARLLADLDHKAGLVRELGAGLFVPLKFDLELAATPADEFLDRLIAARVRTIVVGEDWRFGHKRLGDVELLRQRGAGAGFTTVAAPMVTLDGERVSSTRIRQAVRDGALDSAAAMLGRPFALRGKVVEGRKLARQLGYPTANVSPAGMVTPPDGVWAARAACAGRRNIPGVANLGLRPTVDGGARMLETHLFDFSGDLYAQTMEVEFVRRLRPEIRFSSLDALKEQIAADAALARRWLTDGPAV